MQVQLVWKKLLPPNVQWVSLTLEINLTRTRKFEEKGKRTTESQEITTRLCRISHRKKGVLKNFTRFIEKHVFGVCFLMKLRPEVVNFILKENPTLVFFFCEVLRTPFLKSTSG